MSRVVIDAALAAARDLSRSHQSLNVRRTNAEILCNQCRIDAESYTIEVHPSRVGWGVVAGAIAPRLVACVVAGVICGHADSRW
jgi:hypothetical protein